MLQLNSTADGIVAAFTFPGAVSHRFHVCIRQLRKMRILLWPKSALPPQKQITLCSHSGQHMMFLSLLIHFNTRQRIVRVRCDTGKRQCPCAGREVQETPSSLPASRPAQGPAPVPSHIAWAFLSSTYQAVTKLLHVFFPPLLIGTIWSRVRCCFEPQYWQQNLSLMSTLRGVQVTCWHRSLRSRYLHSADTSQQTHTCNGILIPC